MIARVAVLERAAFFFLASGRGLAGSRQALRARPSVASGEMIVCQGGPGDTIFSSSKDAAGW